MLWSLEPPLVLPLGDALHRPAGIPERESRTGADGVVVRLQARHDPVRPVAAGNLAQLARRAAVDLESDPARPRRAGGRLAGPGLPGGACGRAGRPRTCRSPRRRCPRGTRRVSAGRPHRKSDRPRSATFPSLNARAGLPLPQGCAAALQRERGAPRVSCRPVRKFQNPPPDGGGRAGDRVGCLDLGNRPEEDLRPARRPGRRAGGGRRPCRDRNDGKRAQQGLQVGRRAVPGDGTAVAAPAAEHRRGDGAHNARSPPSRDRGGCERRHHGAALSGATAPAALLTVHGSIATPGRRSPAITGRHRSRTDFSDTSPCSADS